VKLRLRQARLPLKRQQLVRRSEIKQSK
jgi:hypothetical protein